MIGDGCPVAAKPPPPAAGPAAPPAIGDMAGDPWAPWLHALLTLTPAAMATSSASAIRSSSATLPCSALHWHTATQEWAAFAWLPSIGALGLRVERQVQAPSWARVPATMTRAPVLSASAKSCLASDATLSPPSTLRAKITSLGGCCCLRRRRTLPRPGTTTLSASEVTRRTALACVAALRDTLAASSPASASRRRRRLSAASDVTTGTLSSGRESLTALLVGEAAAAAAAAPVLANPLPELAPPRLTPLPGEHSDVALPTGLPTMATACGLPAEARAAAEAAEAGDK